MKSRIFIAINLPVGIKEEIKAIQQKLSKFDWPVRWELSDKWHLTLRFLGDIAERELETVKQIVSESVKDIKSFSLSINGFVAFPNLKVPLVICLKLKESEPLSKLQNKITESIKRAAIGEYERHPFSGHITIGRTKPIHANYRALTKIEFYGKFEVSSVEIMRSILKPKGSVYSVVESYKF